MHRFSCQFSNNTELQHLYNTCTTGCKITSSRDFAKRQKRRQRTQVRILSTGITSSKQTIGKHQIALRTPLSLAKCTLKQLLSSNRTALKSCIFSKLAKLLSALYPIRRNRET